MTRTNNVYRPEIIMLLIERDGGICKGEGCRHVFASMDEMRVDEIDGNPNHNCLRNKQLLCHSCNIKKGLRQKAERQIFPELDTSWLDSSYAYTSRHPASVCVPTYQQEYEHIVTGISECWRPVQSIPEPVIVYSIIPRDRQGIDDSQDTDTSSQTSNKRNEPKYLLYFMLQVKLGYAFRATEAKKQFALYLRIPHGTIKNHYYPTMSEYFERNETGYFIDQRKAGVRSFLEEQEISWMIIACRAGKLQQHWKRLELYAGVLEVTVDELMGWFASSPVIKVETEKVN